MSANVACIACSFFQVQLSPSLFSVVVESKTIIKQRIAIIQMIQMFQMVEMMTIKQMMQMM